MGKRNHDKDTFQKVMRGLAQRTPSAAEIAKDRAREEQIEKERKRIQAESDRIAVMLKRQQEAEKAHRDAELERRKHQS